MFRRGESMTHLRQRIDALMSDQLALRAEMSYLRDKIAVQLARDIEELRARDEATARVLDARTERLV